MRATRERQTFDNRTIAGDGLLDVIRNTADLIFHGQRAEPPPAFRETLAKYGNQKIVKITIRRSPIESGIANAVNLISLGKVSSNKKALNYDNLYHLSAMLWLDRGSAPDDGRDVTLLLEKNAVPVLKVTADVTAYEVVDVKPAISLTLHEFVSKTVTQMGAADYITYDASRLNCQNFIMNHLSANGLLTNDLNEFIMQDAMAIRGADKSLISRLKSITNLGAVFDQIIHGRGPLIFTK